MTVPWHVDKFYYNKELPRVSIVFDLVDLHSLLLTLENPIIENPNMTQNKIPEKNSFLKYFPRK